MTYYYLASPYSRYPHGLAAAHRAACIEAARLIRAGVPVLSPIAHSHHIASYGDVDARDHDLWLRVDESFMRGAQGMIRLMLPGWLDSYGMGWEYAWFVERDFPVIDMVPGVVPEELRDE